LLSDCHRRIEKFLEQIVRVCEVAPDGRLNEEGREALDVALRYFRQAAPLHTSDEEASLFPRLRERAAAGDRAAQGALSAIERLEVDHDAADERHAHIDEIGVRWLRRGVLSDEEVKRLEAEARGLRTFYASHIAVEDDELFPLAAQALSSGAIEEIGREMASRRGLDFDNLPAGSTCTARKTTRPA
jgi:hemerythrin-like domain-containing protein